MTRRTVAIYAVVLGCVLSTASLATEQLVFAVDIIRHGDRTPEKGLPTVPHQWKPGLGQLTAKGMRQEYELGKSRREAYVNRYHLLPATYEPGTVYVRSTTLDRTLMSAESFLLGLYPPGTGPRLSGESALPDGYQPIPIRTVPSNEEKLLYTDGPLYHFDALLEKYAYPSKAWQDKTKAVQPRFTQWSEATGVKITNIKQLFDVADALYIGRLYHVPAPKGLSKQDVDQIIETGQWAFVHEFTDKRIGKITGDLILKNIKDYFNRVAHKATPLRYVLFSAHDSTLLTAMSALESPLNARPPYASYLNFSLFQTDLGKYRVRIKFNNKPVFVPKCGGTSCTLSQFAALAK